MALDERFHRVEQLRLRFLSHVEKGVEVEATAKHRSGFDNRPDRLGHVRESYAHGGAQRVREQSRCAVRAGFQARLTLVQGLQDRHQEERIAFSFAMQALGQPGCVEAGIGERCDQPLGIGISQSGKWDMTHVGVAAQALGQLCEALRRCRALRHDRHR